MTTRVTSVLPVATDPHSGGRTSMTGHQILAAALVLLAMLMSAHAFASGVIGPFPIPPREFSDFAACKAYLEEQHASDQAAVGSTPAADDRVASEQSLQTKGVVQTGDTEVRYEAELGYLSRLVDDERRSIRSQYSYKKKRLFCNEGVLTGTEASGYHIETYEPLE